MKTLTLDFATWRAGGTLNGHDEINVIGKGATMLRNAFGFMCCLGQFSLQCGFDEMEIIDRGEPSQLHKPFDGFNIFDDEFKDWQNTELSFALMAMNDDNSTTYQQKIELIRAKLLKHNIVLNVINLPKMTLRQLKEIIQQAELDDPANLDCEVVIPIKTHMPGMFAFEGVCPAVTEMITIGPSPEYMDGNRGENKHEEMRAFLIASHSFHDDDDNAHETEKQRVLN